jgi:hypothetical protein
MSPLDRTEGENMNAGAKRARSFGVPRGIKSHTRRAEPIPSPAEAHAKTEQASRLSAFSESVPIRHNRVVELKERLRKGAFSPTNDKIAEAILNQTISISVD